MDKQQKEESLNSALWQVVRRLSRKGALSKLVHFWHATTVVSSTHHSVIEKLVLPKKESSSGGCCRRGFLAWQRAALLARHKLHKALRSVSVFVGNVMLTMFLIKLTKLTH
jgi:hypothetical protein